MLVRSAVLDKDMEAAEKMLTHLTETKITGEPDVSAAMIGFLVEGGDVLQIGEIADVLERMLAGTESGERFIKRAEQAAGIMWCVRYLLPGGWVLKGGRHQNGSRLVPCPARPRQG